MYFIDYQLFFFQRTSKPYKNGLCPIYLRIQYKGKRKSLSTRLACSPKDWDEKSRRLNQSSRLAKYLNADLDNWEKRVKECFDHLQATQPSFDLEDVQSLLIHGKKDPGMLEVFDERIDEMAQLIDRGYSKATLTNYKTCRKHLKEYIGDKLSRTEIKIRQVGGPFIDSFHMYLRTTKGCQVNSANKNLRNLRAVLNIALKKGYIDKNPFDQISMKYERKSREFLTEQELRLMMEAQFESKRLEQVRDLFVFACFTGLAYTDIKFLKPEEIITRNESRLIVKSRTKSGIESVIPLFPPAEALLEKYKPYREKIKALIPTPSNQKTNDYLKEIAQEIGISKNVTFHMARHTFATTVSLSNGVPIESVSKMLGHTSVKTTQIYARVMEDKLVEDTRLLWDKY